MSNKIRHILCNKVARYLQPNDNNVRLNIMSQLTLKRSNDNQVYSFALPLRTECYNIESEARNILNDNSDNILTNTTIYKNHLFFNLSRENYITSILQYNYSDSNKLSTSFDAKNIIVEFSSPNIAKPFHVGHLRSSIIGNYIGNINKFLNNDVTKINYLGDWGTQYGFVHLGLKRANITDDQIKTDPIKTLYDAYVFANKEAETDNTINVQARKIFKELETGSDTMHFQWNTFKGYTVTELKKTYARLGIQFDEYHWESTYNIKNIQPILRKLEDTQLMTTDEQGRKVIYLNDTSIPIIKSDGTTLYITRDIAAAFDRYERKKFDTMYYVVDNSQAQHFSALTKLLEAMQLPWARKLKHVKFGKIIGMSTRKGTVIFLEDILNEARDIMVKKQITSPTTKVSLNLDDTASADILGVSAVIINDLKRRRQKNYTFNWDAALSVNGDTGVRLQYCHCRLVSLKENSDAVLIRTCNPDLLQESIVDDLIILIGQFDEIIFKSYETLEPCVLVEYLIRLSHSINKGLYVLRIKGQASDIANQRFLLFHTARIVLAQGMRILGLTPLNKM